MDRTHTCNQVRNGDKDSQVTLIGWAQKVRDHGGLKFIDLRDRNGITQVVFDPAYTTNFDAVSEFKKEYLIAVTGTVGPRPDGTVNKKLPTGEVEIQVKSFELVNKCAQLPFEIDDETTVNEDLRLEYRYLDLRRPSMFKALQNRSKFTNMIHRLFEEEEFINVDTPILAGSSPEGARDFLVPSRKNPGKFFALPQAPQLFKQILMVSGIEKYYQIATCFRDEDLRKDRQYEFKQVDMEVAFWSQEQLFTFMNNVLKKTFKEIYGVEVDGDIEKMPFFEAMEKYGCDKPDFRITLDPLANITEIVKTCGFSVFANNAKTGGLVKGLRLNSGQKLMTRKDIDKLIEFAQKELGAKGLAWMKVNDGKLEGSIAKFFSEEELTAIHTEFKAENGDLLFFISDSAGQTNDILNGLRRELANMFDFMHKDKHLLTWIVDFPLFHFDEGAQKLDFEHNPFVMPMEKDVEYLMSLTTTDILKEDVKAKVLSLVSDCYDLVYNGVEISSGAKRIHKPELQKKMFELSGFSEERIEDNFGWFVKAYNYAAPPHRGCALGLERIITILEGKETIRDVIAFPRNKQGVNPMDSSPLKVDDEQLKDLHIQLDLPKKKEEANKSE
jgi:aspartyl-tRNA synthetase